MSEVARKLALVRAELERAGIGAARFRGVDWFAWMTGGASNVVILTAETGIAEVLVTPERAWIMTDAIEAPRLRAENFAGGAPAAGAFEVVAVPWAERSKREEFVRDMVRGSVGSDRPATGEVGLPSAVVAAKRRLMPEELERYRRLGVDSAEAMTEALRAAHPDWTEFDLLAEGARAQYRRGIESTLMLAAGESRVALHRHPVATMAKLGRRAMLVFCARRHGLFINLTRWVYFGQPTAEERRRHDEVARVEAAAFAASRPGTSLHDAYARIARAYAELGQGDEILKHHQGGTTGYLSREIVATPRTHEMLDELTALAWNPSLPGAKIEDTVVTSSKGIEVLSIDPAWPTREYEQRLRPDVWVSD